jgi:mannose-1-phosphate guanylyltransferase
MAGGAGTRFWPRSRRDKPKQLLKIVSQKTMLQDTFERTKKLTPPEKVLIVTGESLKKEIQSQLPEIPEENIILEPFGRNTAPCIALAATIINKRENNKPATMVVLPADHLIKDVSAFQKSILAATKLAQKEETLITIGIKPTYPEKGYGYIQRNAKETVLDGQKIYKVKTFAEKPNIETARRFLDSGDFYWNAGIFIWTTQTIIKEFESQFTELYELLPNLENKIDTKGMEEEILKVYSATKSISIDYAIMENAENVSVIESEFDWSDVGSWEAVYNLSDKNKNGSVVFSDNAVELNSSNNFFLSENKKLIAAIDVEDLILVETDDAILICKKNSSQKVKDIVDKLRLKEMERYL